MTKLIILFLLSTTCLAYEKEPKFHFMDCVKVVKGFYRGCKGNVIDLASSSDVPNPNYEVSIENCKGGYSFSDTFKEDQLENAKGCK